MAWREFRGLREADRMRHEFSDQAIQMCWLSGRRNAARQAQSNFQGRYLEVAPRFERDSRRTQPALSHADEMR
jgi:hypothetical protein